MSKRITRPAGSPFSAFTIRVDPRTEECVEAFARETRRSKTLVIEDMLTKALIAERGGEYRRYVGV